MFEDTVAWRMFTLQNIFTTLVFSWPQCRGERISKSNFPRFTAMQMHWLLLRDHNRSWLF